MTGEPTVEEQALALADEVLTLRARLRERDDELDRLRAEVAEARNAAAEALGCRFIHDQCDCGDTGACGVCHMVERLRLVRDGGDPMGEENEEADRG